MNNFWSFLPTENVNEADLHKAASLAKWLIEEKGKARKEAYFIAGRKFRVHYSLVCHAYQGIKRKQLKLA